MADWRQIQARIRKAKTGTDAAAKLAELYERTRDAMVAFELAQWHEKAGEHGEAARWYTAAAERFRRSQWKTKAEAALARLRSGAATVESAEQSKVEGVPEAEVAESAEESAPEPPRPTPQARPTSRSSAPGAGHSRIRIARTRKRSGSRRRGDRRRGSVRRDSEETKDRAEEMQGSEAAATTAAPATTETAGPARGKPRRRGRRGGRNRRRGTCDGSWSGARAIASANGSACTTAGGSCTGPTCSGSDTSRRTDRAGEHRTGGSLARAKPCRRAGTGLPHGATRVAGSAPAGVSSGSIGPGRNSAGGTRGAVAFRFGSGDALLH